jgi:hypothetical protein
LNFSIDSPANPITIWTRPSLPNFLHPHISTAISTTNAAEKHKFFLSPQRDQLKTALSRKTNPQSEVTRISSTSAVQQTQIHRLSTQPPGFIIPKELVPISRTTTSLQQKRKRTRRKATNACYQSANTTTPTLPQQTATKPGLAIQHGQGR